MLVPAEEKQPCPKAKPIKEVLAFVTITMARMILRKLLLQGSRNIRILGAGLPESSDLTCGQERPYRKRMFDAFQEEIANVSDIDIYLDFACC